MKTIMEKWINITIYAVIYAVVSNSALIFMGMEENQSIKLTVVSTIIAVVIANYAGVFSKKNN